MTTLGRVMARFLLVPVLIVAVAILVKGYAEVGDGFSAGVVAATAIVLQYLILGYDDTEERMPTRYAPAVAFSGLLLAFLVVFSPVLRGDPLLAHLPAPGDEVRHVGALELHTALLFDIGVALLVGGFIISTARVLAELGEESL